ncbi:hypothetical protein ACFJIW_12230 [Tahibacter sp. UC22_41]|uniref:hypothetical protein n=1 Tax=Tahibacter sp. UC22_41 TaxID=3350178 RepID=UPI0036DF332C
MRRLACVCRPRPCAAGRAPADWVNAKNVKAASKARVLRYRCHANRAGNAQRRRAIHRPTDHDRERNAKLHSVNIAAGFAATVRAAPHDDAGHPVGGARRRRVSCAESFVESLIDDDGELAGVTALDAALDEVADLREQHRLRNDDRRLTDRSSENAAPSRLVAVVRRRAAMPRADVDGGTNSRRNVPAVVADQASSAAARPRRA